MPATWIIHEKNLLSDQNLCKLRTPLLIPILKFRLNTFFWAFWQGLTSDFTV